MSQPWDLPPPLKRGDENDEMTYAAVGRVLSRWEAIEFMLSRIYSVFAERPDDRTALREYGTGKIFRERMQILKRGATQYFTSKPDQYLEGEFDRACQMLEALSARRNDIAHGIVFDIQTVTYFREALDADAQNRPNFALIPTYYAERFHDVRGMPIYAYSSAEMINLSLAMSGFSLQTEDYRMLLIS